MKINFCWYHAIYFFLLIGIFQANEVQAQRSCAQNLATARNLFNSGRFYDVEGTLSACIRSGFNRQEKIEALRLLSLTYLYLDQYQNADSSYLMLLRTNPEYRTNPAADPPDLVFLDESFRHKPIFKWTVSAGLNQVFPRIIYNYSVLQNQKISWSHITNFNFGAGFEYDLYKNLSAAFDASYCMNQYNRNYQDSTTRGTNEYGISWAKGSLYVKYYLGTGKIKPYALAGGSAEYRISANYLKLTRKGTSSSTVGDVVSPPNISLLNNVEPWNYSALIGVGIAYKTSNIYSFAVEITYGAGIKNIINEHKRYEITGDVLQESPIYWNAVPPPHRLDQFTLTLRFINPVYNPKKLKGK